MDVLCVCVDINNEWEVKKMGRSAIHHSLEPSLVWVEEIEILLGSHHPKKASLCGVIPLHAVHFN
ncbi:unnamed protein product [Cylicocyclus nassatus]|uniref:Uncharacterized protein n=1 Tax=Cylicocyclus nassatus TaxID=53992 RepID=A0AA36MC82_CYLNA|nr:unnamed protein product [Cylicocyclus nassatus]